MPYRYFSRDTLQHCSFSVLSKYRIARACQSEYSLLRYLFIPCPIHRISSRGRLSQRHAAPRLCQTQMATESIWSTDTSLYVLVGHVSRDVRQRIVGVEQGG